jgi:hypothetical protein
MLLPYNAHFPRPRLPFWAPFDAGFDNPRGPRDREPQFLGSCKQMRRNYCPHFHLSSLSTFAGLKYREPKNSLHELSVRGYQESIQLSGAYATRQTS